MRILITNIILVGRSGTECVTRDLALGFTKRGHSVVVYSPALGEMADELKRKGITVTDDLDRVTMAPDIIHGHHNIPTVEALIRFPDRPAVWVCHDATVWHDAAPLFPQILRYFAVDETCRDRLVAIDGVESERVNVLHNAVDLDRFIPRKLPLRQRPQNALVYTKSAGHIELIRESCRQLDIDLSVLGPGAGRIVSHPEADLGNFDLVFATARMAIEALAAGCAVVVVDERGFGGLVTSARYEKLRALNFGLRSLSSSVTTANIIAAVQSYDANDAALVSHRIRSEADLSKTLAALENVYADVMEEYKRLGLGVATGGRPLLNFMHQWLPRLLDEPSSWQLERRALLLQIGSANQALEEERVHLGQLSAELAALKALLVQIGSANQALEEERVHLGRLSAELAALKKSRFLKLARLFRRR